MTHSTPVKPELLAPAGNFEKLEIAIHYGADAVYLAGKNFSLRNFSGNFTEEELFQAVQLAHGHNVKVYLACNIYSRNTEQSQIQTFLETVGDINPDAIILADPGIIFQARQIIPQIDIHLSTQSNTTNFNTLNFWNEIGVKRVNLARELSLGEIKEITQKAPIETEAFIHGAMCISYSGRCLLSTFLNNRDSNRGLCSHPCRWKYSVTEEQRPNSPYPVMEDEKGTYIFNSKDLCMIEHIPEIVGANISSLKIEGRMKGINYLATVLKTYRNAIDAYCENPADYQFKSEWLDELHSVYHRSYCTGFYFGYPDANAQNYENQHKGSIHSFIGKIKAKENGFYQVAIKNKLSKSDVIEILSPKGLAEKSNVTALINEKGDPIDFAQPNTIAQLKLEKNAFINDIIRKV